MDEPREGVKQLVKGQRNSVESGKGQRKEGARGGD